MFYYFIVYTKKNPFISLFPQSIQRVGPKGMSGDDLAGHNPIQGNNNAISHLCKHFASSQSIVKKVARATLLFTRQLSCVCSAFFWRDEVQLLLWPTQKKWTKGLSHQKSPAPSPHRLTQDQHSLFQRGRNLTKVHH